MPLARQAPLSLTELEPREVPAADFRTLPVLPSSDPGTLDNARAIAALGETLGRRTDVFLKLGDSNTVDPQYLHPFGNPATFAGVAANYPALVDTLLTFQAPVGAVGENSFTRAGTVRQGGFLPILLPSLQAEINATNAGIALIMIGTNDLGIYRNPEHFRGLYRILLGTLVSQGILPVASTVPPQLQYGGSLVPLVAAFNQVIVDVATEFRVPVWNAWQSLAGLPGQSLGTDLIHLTHSPNGGGSLGPADLQYGQNVRNLQALLILDWYREQVATDPTPVPPLPTWTPLPVDRPVFAVGRGAGQAAVVEVHDTATGELLNRFTAYEPSFVGGVNVAVGDVNGDGFFEVVTAAGGGGGPVVNVFDGKDGTLLSHFFAFDPGFRNGFSVAAGDLDGDAKAEIVVGAGVGGGPAVAVFHGGDFREVNSFFAFDAGFRGGVSVAVDEFADGPAIVVGSGVGTVPQVEFFRYGSVTPIRTVFAFDGSFTGGVNVAAGDLTGDGVAELAVATATLSPAVRLIDPNTGAVVSSLFAGDPSVAAGSRITITAGKLLTGNGPGGDTAVLAFPGLSTEPETLLRDAGRTYGLDVG